MTLATRCPSCATVFRVVQDQLRVSEGWVRCGRCNGVFDATEVLFDIDSGAPVQLQNQAPPPPVAPPPAAAQPLPEAAQPSPPQPPVQPPPDWSDPALPPTTEPGFDARAADWPRPGPIEPSFDDGPPPGMLPPHPQPEEPLLRAPSRSGDGDDGDDRIVITDHAPGPLSAATLSRPAIGRPDEPVVEPPADAAFDRLAAVAASPADSPPPAAQVQAAPSFLRSAEREAWWRRPLVRSGLWGGVLLLAAVALLQMALLWRDNLAAAWPAARPALQALCGVAGCSVQPLRRIESLSVDSSGLNRLEGSLHYRLQLVLRNRADSAVMMPALELALTDGQGALVARRVLQAAELGITQAAMQPGQELPIKALVSTGGRRVDGYTLELFYP